MIWRRTYLAALTVAFLAGLAGTVLAARAIHSGDRDEAVRATHRSRPTAVIPTVEC